MFYYLPLSDLGPYHRGVTAELVFDLPQITIDEARRNPFVRDLVENPYVHAHLLRNVGDERPDTELLNVYNGSPHSYRCQEIKIVYQNHDITPNHAGHREFVFYIYACISEAVPFPEPEFFFTVTTQYDYYLDLFGRDQLVIMHASVHQPPFHLHNYLCVSTGAVTVEVGVINCVSDNQGLQHLVLSDVGQTEITITNANRDIIHPIRMTDELLTQMGFVMTTSAIYRYPEQDHFDKPITVRGETKLLSLIRRGQYSYELLVEDARTAYGTMAYQVDYLHDLQIQIRACYQYDLTPNPGNLKGYLQRKQNDSYFTANHRHLIKQYYDGLKHPLPTRAEFLNDVAQYYRISIDIARTYMEEMILAGEITLR